MAEKIQMPQSGGGLMRYFDDVKSRFKFSPWWVLISIVIVLIVEFLLHKSGWLA